jgi:hypothetical protein
MEHGLLSICGLFVPNQQILIRKAQWSRILLVKPIATQVVEKLAAF